MWHHEKFQSGTKEIKTNGLVGLFDEERIEMCDLKVTGRSR